MHHPEIVRPRALMTAQVLLLLAERPRHGYELADALRAMRFEHVTTSVVYRELARLEDARLVVSFWESSQARGPARHMYELTPEGRADLELCAADVRLLIEHLTDFLGRCAEQPDGRAPAPAPAPAPPGRPVSALAKLFKAR